MIKFLKMALTVMILSIFSTGSVLAADYTVKGYITTVKADNDKGNCYLELSQTPNGPRYQGGYWYCNAIYAQIMFELTKTSLLQLWPVTVMFNSGYKLKDDMWVYAVEGG